MKTITCKELSGGVSPCTTPISGNTAEEVKKSLMAHGQKDHPEQIKSMTPEIQKSAMQKIDTLFA